MFKHVYNENVIEEELKRIEIDGLRHYQDADGHIYKSVTSFLSKFSDDSIKKWKERVGEEVANRISRAAAAKGTAIHLACERYLDNENAPERDLTFDELYDWKILKPSLKEHINNITGQEIRMKSRKLNLAGTADCIAEFDGVTSLIDFKTSKRYKSKEDIWSYWIQTAAYAVMAWEMWRVKIDQLVIVMIVDKDRVVIHKEPSIPWMKEVLKLTAENNNNA